MLARILFAGAFFASSIALAAPRADNAWLTQAEAAARAARVSQVDYAHAIDLTGHERFSATSTISFDLKDTSEALTIDLDQAAIATLSVNGKPLAPQYNNWFITIAASDLAPGRNTVAVSYTRAYNSNGEGLHRTVDAADGKAYLFSQLAPANAHQVFALFDQPDLKARYALSVVAPADWQVVSAARENRIDDLGATRRWTFPATKKMSAYAFSLHAGPYHVWEDNSGKYPLRLFARQSVAARVPAADWFRQTRAGFTYYDRYFGIPYQFEKYDQLLVPDHRYGAMENIAAVTFAEKRFLSAQTESLARVIMHEMAHQWFGDLVTMEWWNGLWLSESFASLMASMALEDGAEFKDPWKTFFIIDKQRGYALDQGPRTHPVDAAIASSANAYDNLDAITYIKGASALKQLRHLLGEDAFRSGVRQYLARNQFGNARLDDFIGELGKAAGRDLGPWTRKWLYTAGVNTITPEYSCRKGKIARFALRQSEQPTPGAQRVQVATFGAAMTLQKKVVVEYKGPLTPVPALVGSACPAVVYPNYQDWGYLKVQLDQRSMAAIGEHIARADDPLLRSMLWHSLWDGVQAGRYPLKDFMQAATAASLREKDQAVLADLVKKMEGGASRLTPAIP
jgi:aminopeptidase N